MKKRLCLIMVAAVLLSVTACGGDTGTTDTAATTGISTTTTTITTTTVPSEPTATDNTTTTTESGIVLGPDDGYFADDSDTSTTTTTTKKPTTTKSTTTTTTAVEKHQYSALELEIFRLLNVERENAGVAPLVLNDEYHICAETRAKEISVSWGHTRPNGERYNTVFGDFGFYPRNYQAAENIGMGYGDAEVITKALMDSEPHRRNMLSPKATEVIIAVFIDDNGKIYLDEIFLAKKE